MDRKYIGAGLFLVAAIVVCIVLVYPKYQQARMASKAAAEKEQEFKTQSEFIAAVNKAYGQYKKIDRELSIVQDLLPPQDDQSIAKLFIEFEELASQSGLSIQTLSFGVKDAAAKTGAEPGVKEYNIINAILSAAGSYGDLKKFADAVRFNKHLMDIISINVSEGAVADASSDPVSAGQQGKSGNEILDIFSFKFSINAYYQ